MIPTTLMAMVSTLFAQSAPQITGDWKVDIRTVCSVGGVVLALTWYIRGWMKKIEAGQAEAKKDRESVYRQLGQDRQEFRETFKEIFNRLNERPRQR